MKIRYLAFILFTGFIRISPISAATLDVSGLRVSVENIVTGLENSSSASIGEYSSISYPYCSLDVGEFNYASYNYCTFVLGSNDVSAVYSFVGGMANNVPSGGYSLVYGYNNYLYGGYATLLGRGIIYNNEMNETAKTIVGQYNYEIEDPVFVVGNGVDGNNRSNALEIRQNGTVRIPTRQGDVGMGRFGYAADQ